MAKRKGSDLLKKKVVEALLYFTRQLPNEYFSLLSVDKVKMTLKMQSKQESL